MNTGNSYIGSVATPAVILPYQAVVVLDMMAGNFFEMTLGGNLNLSNPVNVLKDGQPLLLRLIQDGVGSRLLTLGGSQFRFGTTIASVTLSTSAGLTDYVGFLWNLTAQKWDCVSVAQGY